MMFIQARRRLMAMNVLVMAVVIGVLGAGVVLLMEQLLIAQETAEIGADARHAAEDFGRSYPGHVRLGRDSYASGTFYVVWNTSGQVIFNSADVPTAPLRGRTGTTVTESFLLVSVPLSHGGKQIGVLQAGHSLAPLQAVERQAILVVGLASAFALLFSLAGSWFLADRALAPIRLAMERQKAFTADASHELRTPLSVIDASIQVLRRHPEETVDDNRELLESMGEESQRMGRLVASLLTLARADSGDTELQVADVDVEALVRAAARDLEPVAAAQGVPIRLRAAGAGRAALDADRIKQLVLILLDNALKHGPAGSPIEVSCYRTSRSLVLDVGDRGPGIPVGERERVFDRFHRVDPGRSGPGAGLGLAIAKWIASAHGGSITLHDNHPGLRARVTLPITGGAKTRPWRRLRLVKLLRGLTHG
jgi:two-component system, OmpR family, sensor histidine kinase CiaH